MGWFEEQGRQSPTPYRGATVRPMDPSYTPQPSGGDGRAHSFGPYGPGAGGAAPPGFVNGYAPAGYAPEPVDPRYVVPSGPTSSLPTQDFRRGAGQSPAPAAGGGGGAAGAFDEGALQEILNKYPPTNDGMRQAMVEVDRTFGPGTVQLLDHPTKLDKLVLPNGKTIDTIVGSGGPNPSWGWQVEGAGHGGGTLGGLSGGGLPQGVGPVLGSPMAGRSWQDDPGVQVRLEHGLKALERSAAAKGTLLTGGAAKGLMRFAQDYTSQEYQNAYGRAAAEQGNNFNRLFSVAGLGANATGNAQQLASGYAGNIAGTQIGQGNAAAGATQAGANANANTVGSLSNLAGQWLTDRYGGTKAPAVSPETAGAINKGVGFWGM